ncbi:MAG: SoxR reducing system RseC family protein [Methyloglobulus sp.]|jgi:sigma-E factor negative regulatory protein RseC|nr:SoxR reducing system RseC family protein [Methyloglobulus sp.]
MIEELAVVVKIENYQVWVEGGQNSACGGCLQKASCTTNALGSVLKKKSVRVDSDIELKIGDNVMVAIDEAVLLQASLLLYLLPLIALFTGAGLADWLLADNIRYADLWIAASALSGFLLCLWLINKAQNLMILGYYARPTVVKKISPCMAE